MTPPLNLNGLPWFLGQVVLRTLANEKCSPDLVLVLADAIEECVDQLLPLNNPYLPHCRRVAAELRDRAARFRAPGKPLGDFDGSLTP